MTFSTPPNDREIRKFSLPIPDSGSQLATAEIESPTAVVPGALYRGHCSLLSGAPKAGKSSLVRDWLRRIHEGFQTYGAVEAMVPTGSIRPVNTLILSEETAWQWAEFAQNLPGTDEDKDWLRILHRGHGRIAPSSSADLDDWVDAVIDMGKTYEAGLILIDPVTRFGSITSENDNSEVLRALMSFERIASETGAALCLLHHTTKGGNEPRGCSAWQQQPDVLLSFRSLSDKEIIETEETTPDRIRILSGKGRFPEIESQVACYMDEENAYHHLPGVLNRFVSIPEYDGERVLAVMSSRVGEWGAKEISDTLGMDIQKVRRALRNLCARNRLVKNGDTKNATYATFGA